MPWAETLTGARPLRGRAAQWSESVKHPVRVCCYKATREVTRQIEVKDNHNPRSEVVTTAPKCSAFGPFIKRRALPGKMMAMAI